MLWGKDEPILTWELGSHVRRQGPWKPVSVPNHFGINGKEKPHPAQGILFVKSLNFNISFRYSRCCLVDLTIGNKEWSPI